MSWLLLLTISALVNFSLASASAPTFRISVGEPGVYRVPYEALVAAGLPSEPVKSSALGLLQRDETVPIWVADGGDGVLGPGDWFEFVGKRLSGENRYFHEYSSWNPYWLHLDRNFRHRMKVQAAASQEEIETAGASGLPLRALQHLEEDRLLIRLSGHEVKGLAQPEVWYWAKLTQIDSDPFGVPLNLGDLDTTSPQKVFLKLHFRALSHPQGLANNGLTDHHVDLSLNGKPIARANWNGRTTYLLELPPLEVATFTAGENKLTLSVPARTAPNGSDPVVDVAMLDWIEVDYPRRKPQISLGNLFSCWLMVRRPTTRAYPLGPQQCNPVGVLTPVEGRGGGLQAAVLRAKRLEGGRIRPGDRTHVRQPQEPMKFQVSGPPGSPGPIREKNLD